MAVVEVLDSLFEPDGDQQTDGDGGNVDREALPGVDGFMWRMCFSSIDPDSCTGVGAGRPCEAVSGLALARKSASSPSA
jgi:hypothetical protein